jgi:S1-C subfamily serine protease
MTILPTPTPITIIPIPTATPQPIVNFNQVYSKISPSVFKITAGNGHGTGWIIESGLIATNEHVVRGQTTVTVHQVSHEPFKATVIATDSKRDIALLAYNKSVTLDPNAIPLSLGTTTNADLAQPLMALGYSGEAPVNNGIVDLPSANVGVLSLIIDLGPNSRGYTLVMDVPVDPGDSGGPVVNSTGEVVGMTTGVVETSTAGQRVVGTFYALHVDEIKSSLPALKSGLSR